MTSTSGSLLSPFLKTKLTDRTLSRLTIKGQSNEDAVLCTADKTFSMRSIGLSNTVLVVTPVPDVCASDFAEDALIIRDQLNEIIELVPAVPKLHKLAAVIRDRQYGEGQEDDIEQDENAVCRFPRVLPIDWGTNK